VWNDFAGAPSKGLFIKEVLNTLTNGPADIWRRDYLKPLTDPDRDANLSGPSSDATAEPL